MKRAKELIDSILEKCADKDYIFRGTTQVFSNENEEDSINSSLYRWAKDKKIISENYKAVDIEKEIVEEAQRLFSPNTSNIEILTDLRHYGGKVNLIDFSCDLNVALFFACNGDFDKNGELVLFNVTNYKPIKEDIDHNNREVKVSIVRPANTQTSQRRTIYQSSIFLFTQDGYIKKDSCEVFFFKIKKEIKPEILNFLEKFHNVSVDTIYNDMIGFIANEKNYETAGVNFYKGLVKNASGEHKEAIKHYDEAIKINPQFFQAYNNRGNAKSALGKHEEAIEDCDKAIKINPQLFQAYNNRGNAKSESGRHEEAIEDYNKAIEINPQYARAYYNRGNAKSESGRHEEAIEDYNKAIEINPQYATAYNNRGHAKSALGRDEEAKEDFNKAKELASKL